MPKMINVNQEFGSYNLFVNFNFSSIKDIRIIALASITDFSSGTTMAFPIALSALVPYKVYRMD